MQYRHRSPLSSSVATLSSSRGARKRLPFRGPLVGCAIALMTLARAATVEAATITVTTTEDELNQDGDCSLREAIEAANTNAAVDACTAGDPGADVIDLPAGTYDLSITGKEEDSNQTGDLDVLEDLTIQGQGAEQTIIDANGVDRVLHIVGAYTVEVAAVTITGGEAAEAVISSGPNDQWGGGIFSYEGDLTVTECTISGNVAGRSYHGSYGGYAVAGMGGGIAAYYGSLQVVDSTITNNKAGDAWVFKYGEALGGFGGGIMLFKYVNATIENTVVSHNSAGAAYSMLYAGSGYAMGGFGGGIAAFNYSELSVSSCVISHNTAGSSAGPFAMGGHGGGIHAGGNIHNPNWFKYASVDIADSVITGNRTGRGFANDLWGGAGWVPGLGGGVGAKYGSTVSVSRSTIELNTAGEPEDRYYGSGGGLSMKYADLTLASTLVANNAAAEHGGGITFLAPGYGGDEKQAHDFDLVNCTLSGNSAGGIGGAIYAWVGEEAPMSVSHSTIVSNVPDGIYLDDDDDYGSSVIRSSIVAGNDGVDCLEDAALVTDGYNVFGENGSCESNGTTDQTVDEAQLFTTVLSATLAENGGPTRTHALLEPSPARDSGATDDPDGNAVTEDQRGVSRPIGTGHDVGAFETLLFPGDECPEDSECMTELCVDDVCCDLACEGQCEACDVAGSEGTCTAVTGEPHGDRDPCNGDGVCQGSCDGTLREICAYPDVETECRDPSCGQGMETLVGYCDAEGECQPEVQQSCGLYICGEIACLDLCEDDTDCVDGAYCLDSTCVTDGIQGAACSFMHDCAAGLFCADGRCCNSSCAGQCEACNVAGSEGTCTPIMGEPRGDRPPCDGEGECQGSCDGINTEECIYPECEEEAETDYGVKGGPCSVPSAPGGGEGSTQGGWLAALLGFLGFAGARRRQRRLRDQQR